MKYLTSVDGRVCDLSELRSDLPYVMQRIHTLHGRAYNVEHHLALLCEASAELLGFTPLVDADKVRAAVAELLDMAHAPTRFSVPVAMRLNSRGEHILIVERPTFGAGAYLRAKRVDVAPVVCHTQFDEWESSASVAYDAMLDHRSYARGGERAIPVSEAGYVLSRPWLLTLVVAGDTVYSPSEHHSVEYAVARRAVEAAGMHFVVRPIPLALLDRADEILFIDIMGIIAATKIGDHRLSFSAAIRLAQQMQP